MGKTYTQEGQNVTKRIERKDLLVLTFQAFRDEKCLLVLSPIRPNR